MDLGSDPSGYRARSPKLALTSDASCKWGPQASCHSIRLGYKFRGSHNLPSDPIVQQNDSQNSGKPYTYGYCFVIKDTNEEPEEKVYRARSGKVLSAGASGVRVNHPPGTVTSPPTRKLPKPGVLSYWGFIT